MIAEMKVCVVPVDILTCFKYTLCTPMCELEIGVTVKNGCA